MTLPAVLAKTIHSADSQKGGFAEATETLTAAVVGSELNGWA